VSTFAAPNGSVVDDPPRGPVAAAEHAAVPATHASEHGAVPAVRVPFARMDYADPALLEELLGAVREVAEHGAFTLGHHVESFEREFADYCESDFALGVSSGTEALVLALRALEIGPGDEVLVPANSFIATAESVSAVGATPVPLDVDPDSHLLTAELIAPAVGPRVRCVIPVHLFGATVDLDPILALAREAGLHVIEDACQAHGARYRGRSSPTVCGCCAPMGSARATTTAWSAPPRGWTRCRRRCCDASSGASTVGTTSAAGSAPSCVSGWVESSTRSACPSQVPTTSTTCSWCAASGAMSCASTWLSTASPRASTTPCRSTAPRPTRSSASARAAFRSARRWRSGSARCRSFRG
jgi:hypothetical protein